MPCYVTKPRPITFREAHLLTGHGLRDDLSEETLNMIMPGSRPEDGPMITCFGEGAPVTIVTCPCGYEAELLCDWPAGEGKTCDLPLCQDCAKVIGDDRHACEIHWHVFKRETGVLRMNPLGPRLVR